MYPESVWYCDNVKNVFDVMLMHLLPSKPSNIQTVCSRSATQAADLRSHFWCCPHLE